LLERHHVPGRLHRRPRNVVVLGAQLGREITQAGQITNLHYRVPR
jgi:hypothetical protein